MCKNELSIDYFTSGVTSAQSVFGIIDREPIIDKYDDHGETLRIVFLDFPKYNIPYP